MRLSLRYHGGSKERGKVQRCDCARMLSNAALRLDGARCIPNNKNSRPFSHNNLPQRYCYHVTRVMGRMHACVGTDERAAT